MEHNWIGCHQADIEKSYPATLYNLKSKIK